MINIQLKIGNQAIKAELPNMDAVHKFNAVYAGLPQKCDACSSSNIYLSYKNPKGNDYFMLECGDCKATANFGIHKDGQGKFWKGEKMAVYVPTGGQQSNTPQEGLNPNNFEDNQEVPF